MIAARTGCGRLRRSPEKNSVTTRTRIAAKNPESEVLAPALSLTSDCDIPPLTGKPRPSPAARLAAASDRNSWLASSR
jgi:hypothetical protein